MTDILILHPGAGARTPGKEALPMSFRDLSIRLLHGLANMRNLIPYGKPHLTQTRGDSGAEMPRALGRLIAVSDCSMDAAESAIGTR